MKKQIILPGIKKAMDCWNERLKKLLDQKGYKQTQFAKMLNERYGTNFTQPMVNDWLNVGSERERSGKRKILPFPSYPTMFLIAEFLNIDVGYLTGETDEETFTLEKACDYMQLTSGSINAIRKITDANYFGNRNDFFSQERRKVLNALLTAKRFEELICALIDLDKVYIQKNTETVSIQELEEKLGKDLFDTAVKNYDITEFDDNVADLTDKECEAIQEFKSLLDRNFAASENFKYDMGYNRFIIQETMTLLLNDLYPMNLDSII